MTLPAREAGAAEVERMSLEVNVMVVGEGMPP
jgi:hypothetical protein